MTRYMSIEEVDQALIELEEHERTFTADKANNEKHSDTEKPSSRTTPNASSVNGQSAANGIEENGGAHEDVIGESDIDSGSDTIDPGHDEEEELDEENHDGGCDSEDDEDDGVGGPASDEDDEVCVRQKLAEVDPQEEADFERELRALLQARFSLIGSLCAFAFKIFIYNALYSILSETIYLEEII